jgi:hypothetical protein
MCVRSSHRRFAQHGSDCSLDVLQALDRVEGAVRRLELTMVAGVKAFEADGLEVGKSAELNHTPLGEDVDWDCDVVDVGCHFSREAEEVLDGVEVWAGEYIYAVNEPCLDVSGRLIEAEEAISTCADTKGPILSEAQEVRILECVFEDHASDLKRKAVEESEHRAWYLQWRVRYDCFRGIARTYWLTVHGLP